MFENSTDVRSLARSSDAQTHSFVRSFVRSPGGHQGVGRTGAVGIFNSTGLVNAPRFNDRSLTPASFARGSAICAAVGCGLFEDIPAACKAMVHVERVVSPNPDLKDTYRRLVERYKGLYEAMRSLRHNA